MEVLSGCSPDRRSLSLSMYRIHRVFDNSTAVLIKIAGEVTDSDLIEWTGFLDLLGSWANREIILDFCEVPRISSRALIVLVERFGPNLRLLNCPKAMKNALASFGLSDRLVDNETSAASLKLRRPSDRA